jgi:catechol 2,3-dioxygenase-like lactoylglutathione lyase family enzyme
MIDHVSVGVRELKAATAFYDAVLGILGFTKLETRATTVAFGKQYPEFWINLRPDLTLLPETHGTHIALRAARRSSMRFTRRRSSTAASVTACRGCGRNMARVTTPRSSAIRTATGSKR